MSARQRVYEKILKKMRVKINNNLIAQTDIDVRNRLKGFQIEIDDLVNMKIIHTTYNFLREEFNG